MELKHLQYFIEVTRLKSFSKAASKLFVTQPTISKMIRNLEEEMGVRLFDRTNKKVKLTDAGRVVFEQAKIIDQAIKDLDIQLENLINLKMGNIGIGMPPMIGSLYFPNIIGQFHDQYPEISIQLFEAGSHRIEGEIELGNLDLGVVALPINEKTFHCFPFEIEKIKLVVPKNHRLAKRKRVILAELKEESFILFNDDFALHNQIISSCEKEGFKPQIVSKSSQWDFIGKMVSAGLGIAFMPEQLCSNFSFEVSALEVTNPNLQWELAIIWQKDRYLSNAAKEWLRFIKEQVTLKK